MSKMTRIKIFIFLLPCLFLLFLTNFENAYAFSFSAAGDYGSNSNTDTVLRGIGSAAVDFNLALGDFSYGVLSENAWCDYVKARVGNSFPFELVVGNHDSLNSQEAGLADYRIIAGCLPNRVGNITGSYPSEYYFDYQNTARFIQISPNIKLDSTTPLSYAVGSSRYNWVASAIDGARAAGIPWVIVSMHKNCLTLGVNTCEIGTDLMNLLINKKVDLVFNGHDHTYQRSKQIVLGSSCINVQANVYNPQCIADDGLDGSYSKGAGTIFLVNGTGGDDMYPINVTDPEVGYFSKWMGSNLQGRFGFTKVIVDQNQLTANFVGTTSTSNFSDTFTISNGSVTPTPTPTPTSTPIPDPNAFSGQYFSNANLTGNPVLTRNDASINFDWGVNTPDSIIPTDNFSVRWTKNQNFAAGNYTFNVTGDDGVRLKIDGVTVIDKWINQSTKTYTYNTNLTAGNHAIIMEYFDSGWDAVAKLSWTLISATPSPSPSPTPTPTASPSPTPTTTPVGTPSDTFSGQYYSNMTLTGSPALTRNDTSVNFDWATSSPGTGIPVDKFSARWTKVQNFSAGTYKFSVTADDGVRLIIDGVTVINKWSDQSTSTFTYNASLTSGTHTVVMEYYENAWDAVAKLSWTLISATPTPTPTPSLAPTPTPTIIPTINPTPVSTPIPSQPSVDFSAEYYSNMTLSGSPILTRNDPSINFDWAMGSPGAGVPVDKFSARWTKTQNFAAGNYRFSVTADDGVRLKIDGTTVIDKWKDQGATTYTYDTNLTNGNHTIIIEYYENGWDAVAKMTLVAL